MSQLDEIMTQVPIDQIAQMLGADPAQVQEAARSAIPALVGGMKANADDPAGARSLAGALNDHAGSDVSSLDAIDSDDGQKIVQNIFGGNTDNVISTLGGRSGSSDLIGKLLPILAPIVMSLIARQMAGGGGLGGMFGGGSAAGAGGGSGATVDGSFGARQAPGGAGGGLGGLTDMLGSILGGGPGQQGGSQQAGAGGLDDLLGGVLGGMLGGGKR